jgi:hypothetical protein
MNFFPRVKYLTLLNRSLTYSVEHGWADGPSVWEMLAKEA